MDGILLLLLCIAGHVQRFEQHTQILLSWGCPWCTMEEGIGFLQQVGAAHALTTGNYSNN